MGAIQKKQAQPITLTDAITNQLDDEALDYITEQGAKIGTQSALIERFDKKEKALKAKIAESPEGRQLATLRKKRAALKEERRDTISKVSGVLEQQIGKEAQKALEEIVDEPKRLSR